MAVNLPDKELKSAANYSTLWTFNYRRGNATFSLMIDGPYDMALNAARLWCKHENAKLLGDKLWPAVISARDILKANPEPANSEVLV